MKPATTLLLRRTTPLVRICFQRCVDNGCPNVAHRSTSRLRSSARSQANPKFHAGRNQAEAEARAPAVHALISSFIHVRVLPAFLLSSLNQPRQFNGVLSSMRVPVRLLRNHRARLDGSIAPLALPTDAIEPSRDGRRHLNTHLATALAEPAAGP